MSNPTSNVSAVLGGKGGSGFALGPVQNAFNGADRRAAETARNTYAGANAGWLALYDGDRANWIQLTWDGGHYVIQRRNAAGTGWEDVTNVIIGPRGRQGIEGPPGAPDDAAIDARIADYARAAPSGTIGEAQIPAEIARGADISSAIDALKGGVPADMDTLAELAAAIAARLTEEQTDDRFSVLMEAAVTGNTERGIAVGFENGKLNFVVGGQHASLYFGTSADATPEGSELTVAGRDGTGTIAAYAGSRHHLIARLASEPDITSVIYSDDQSMTNQLGAFTKFAGTVIPSGEAQPYNVWVSNQALTQDADVGLAVR